ncbi:MAG: alpha/beta hydrolase [Pseudomonadales bacterium]|nr:alpha/beta hydrolase [Pseudomonadales bacterium]
MESRIIEIQDRASIRVYEGGSGPDLFFLHGAGGLLQNDPFLNALMENYRVTAPLLPGYEDSESEHLRDMLDFTLHSFDVLDQLNLNKPLVVGHSMGGMIAAEMAAIAPDAIERLALICPAGFWSDDHPIPDLFALLPYELPGLMFHDPEKNGDLMSAGGDFNDPEFLTEFLVGNAKRMGSAGKILFPIPDRGLSERAYRIKAKTEILWGAQDKLIVPHYASLFSSAIANSNLTMIQEAGHMLPYEQTSQVLEVIAKL